MPGAGSASDKHSVIQRATFASDFLTRRGLAATIFGAGIDPLPGVMDPQPNLAEAFGFHPATKISRPNESAQLRCEAATSR